MGLKRWQEVHLRTFFSHNKSVVMKTAPIKRAKLTKGRATECYIIYTILSSFIYHPIFNGFAGEVIIAVRGMEQLIMELPLTYGRYYYFFFKARRK